MPSPVAIPCLIAALIGAVAPATLAADKVTTPSVLPFIDDDYPRALATARRTGKPLFVDAWATWCHTCLSMRSFIFNNPALRPLAKHFVWAALDVEKEHNAAFVKAHPIQALPMFLVVDARTDQVIQTWNGGLTLAEFRGWLDQARAALPSTDPGAQARAMDAQVLALTLRKDHPACAQKAAAAFAALPPGTARLEVALNGLTCARQLPAGDLRASLETPLLAELEAIAAADDYPAMADDRSSVFDLLVEAAEQDHDAARVQRFASAWATFLDGQAAHAPTAAARAVFDPHRLTAFLALKQPQHAIPMLLQSARDFPADYNPPARLARAYLVANQLPAARAAIDRALTLAYGPRRRRLLALKSEIDQASEAATPSPPPP
jgi:thiol-disulfide isomerase/thioredoxin